MKKISILFIVSLLVITFSNNKINAELKEELEDSNLTLNYINYIVNKNNTGENKKNYFTSTFLSFSNSELQQSYYIDTMYILKGKYEEKDLELLKNIFFQEKGTYNLQIIFQVIKEKDILTKKEKEKLIEYCEKILKKSDVDKDYNQQDFYYSFLILNKYKNYTENIDKLLQNFNREVLEKDEKSSNLIEMYFYLELIDNLNYTENFKIKRKEIKDNIKTKFLKIKEEIKDFEDDLQLYYFLCLINYFDIKIDSNNFKYKPKYNYFNNYLDLLEPDLCVTYFNIYYAVTLNLLSQEEKDFLIRYYESLETEDGFRSYSSCNSQNLDYAYYLLLNLLENKNYNTNEYKKYKNLYLPSEIPIYNKYKNKSSLYLYLSSLIQNELKGKIDNKLKKEVTKKLKNYNKKIEEDNFDFSQVYYLFLIAKKFDFLDKIENNKYLKENYLCENFKKNVNEQYPIEALKYFDILTLYYPNNNNINNFYEELKNSLNKSFKLKDISSESILIRSVAALKSIELRIDKFENNIDELLKDNIKKVDNFVIVKGLQINSLDNYYHYFYLKELNKDININKNYVI